MRSSSAQLAHDFADDLVGVHVHFPSLIGADAQRAVRREDFAPGRGRPVRPRGAARRTTCALPHADLRTADAGVGAAGLAGRSGGVDDATPAHVERLRWRRRDAVHQGRAADRRSRSTGSRTPSPGRCASTSTRSRSRGRRSHDRTPTLEAPFGMAVFRASCCTCRGRWPSGRRTSCTGRASIRGGHFAAAEEPDLIVEDLRAFFRPLR